MCRTSYHKDRTLDANSLPEDGFILSQKVSLPFDRRGVTKSNMVERREEQRGERQTEKQTMFALLDYFLLLCCFVVVVVLICQGLTQLRQVG